MPQIDRDLKASCHLILSRPSPPSAAQTLARLAQLPQATDAVDVYGEGGAVAELEQATLAHLDKPAGLFFIKGVTAQLCVLRAYAQARSCNNVVIHPLSHIGMDEASAVERVAGLQPIRLGRTLPFTAAQLDALTEPLAAVVVELPLRRAGYLLPDIDELHAISRWCREHQVPLHFDGARLWEAAAGYGLSLAELAGLADSVYVSYYKGLGGLGGALVAGSESFVASLKVWKTRYGGDLFTAYPQAISALDGLQHRLPRLPEFVSRARALATALADIPGLVIHPHTPHTNAFQLWLPGTPASLAEQHRHFAQEHGVWLFDAFAEAPLYGYAMTEVEIGPMSDHYRIEDTAAAIRQFAGIAASGA
ncbi:aminotransferase class I/II-fold pyridoxal phosphate-dependent enzyme [Oleiagrimonas sp. C23AA]|uniref:threonine aldolase family protein n=1 Tax=Oleiagrimonas sp. C23AA TaxID=2719047 RepID=UPI00141ED039|nr:aminotransferase class I/II-fold pyridoxal phosphate-dependent enzyme [Oleiagrimonas sp. C23AA]NII09699.1 threonine aldolase [Oleiagrimonas sp. C23AA]